jgi:hypothetical protein
VRGARGLVKPQLEGVETSYSPFCVISLGEERRQTQVGTQGTGGPLSEGAYPWWCSTKAHVTYHSLISWGHILLLHVNASPEQVLKGGPAPQWNELFGFTVAQVRTWLASNSMRHCSPQVLVMP